MKILISISVVFALIFLITYTLPRVMDKYEKYWIK